jgi:enoyl-CoA hydratase/carnithine racemase
MRYLLTGDRFTADEAYRMGLVQELVEPGQHVERALEIATSIAEQAPLAVRATLANARKALTAGQAAAVADLPDLIRHISSTDDATEGMISFLERRKATFHGR